MVASHCTGRLCGSVRYTGPEGTVRPPAFQPCLPAVNIRFQKRPDLPWSGPPPDDHGTLAARQAAGLAHGSVGGELGFETSD